MGVRSPAGRRVYSGVQRGQRHRPRAGRPGRLRPQPGRSPAADRVEAQEKKAKASMVVLGVGLIALSLLFSLSRSGIAFAAAGAALFLYLNRGARRSYVAIALAGVLAAALWIGIDPVVSRFGFVADDLAGGSGRTAGSDGAGAAA